MINMEGDFLKKSRDLLAYFYKKTKGDVNRAITENSPLIAETEKEGIVESKHEYMRIRAFLEDDEYISVINYGGDLKRSDLSITAKGINEVLKNYPTLTPRTISPISNIVDLFSKIDEQGVEIKEKIDEIKNMERHIEDLRNDMQIIKTILSERLPDIKDPESQDIIKELLASPNLHTFLTLLFRFARNPKTKELFEEILLSDKSPIALPPRTQI